MFNLMKVMSSFNNVQAGMIPSILKQAVPSISQTINTQGLLEGLSKMLAGSGGQSAAGAVQQVAQSIGGFVKGGIGGPAGLEALPAALTKTMYISILLEAVEDARAKKSFNVETAINDLWVKLSRVRPAQNQNLTTLLNGVNQALKRQNDAAMSLIQNMR